MSSLTRRRVPPAFRLPPVANDAAATASRRAVATAAGRELWLALHLQGVILESLRPAAAPRPDAQPVAVVDLEHDGKVVCACDDLAAAAGVTPGMALNSALALMPELQTLPRDPARERALLDAVAQLGLGFTPRVSLEPPDAVLLEVRGSLRLFGGVRALCEQVRERLQAAGVDGAARAHARRHSRRSGSRARGSRWRCAASTSWQPGWRRCRSR